MMFYVVLHPEEDGWIVGQCSTLHGCIGQGKNGKEALGNTKEAIAGWRWAEDQMGF